MLCTRHHCCRSSGHGASLRTLLVGGTAASGLTSISICPAESSASGDPVCLSALWRTRRSDDRQCHHLSRQVGSAGGWQGIGVRYSNVDRLSALSVLGNGADRMTRSSRASVLPGFDLNHLRICKVFLRCASHAGHSPSSRSAFWWHGDLPGAAQLRVSRSNKRLCPDELSSNGTRKIAPTWESSKSICSAWA